MQKTALCTAALAAVSIFGAAAKAETIAFTDTGGVPNATSTFDGDVVLPCTKTSCDVKVGHPPSESVTSVPPSPLYISDKHGNVIDELTTSTAFTGFVDFTFSVVAPGTTCASVGGCQITADGTIQTIGSIGLSGVEATTITYQQVSVTGIGTVVSVSGVAGQADSFNGTPMGVTWTALSSYNNVTVTALLQNMFGTKFTGTAWLMSRIGPSASQSDVVATAPFTVQPVGGAIDQTVTLFSNLTLPAGTYYLILNTPTGLIGTAGWRTTTDITNPSAPPTITTGAAVTYTGDLTTITPSTAFPPASVFGAPGPFNFIFSVTGILSPPAVKPSGIVPIFSSATTIQSGSWVSIYGVNLATAPATWNNDFPTSLGGTSVTIDGKAAYLWYVSPGQINLQAPDDATAGTVDVLVTNALGTIKSSAVLGQVGPSLSVLDGKHVAGIISRNDGSGANGGGTYDIVGPTGTSLGYRTTAARAGDNLVLFGVGFGPTNPAVPSGKVYSGAAPTVNSVQFLIDNVVVNPVFSGITSAGLYQMNLVVPPGSGAGDVPIIAMVSGVQTQTGVVLSLQ